MQDCLGFQLGGSWGLDGLTIDEGTHSSPGPLLYKPRQRRWFDPESTQRMLIEWSYTPSVPLPSSYSAELHAKEGMPC